MSFWRARSIELSLGESIWAYLPKPPYLFMKLLFLFCLKYWLIVDLSKYCWPPEFPSACCLFLAFYELDVVVGCYLPEVPLGVGTPDPEPVATRPLPDLPPWELPMLAPPGLPFLLLYEACPLLWWVLLYYELRPIIEPPCEFSNTSFGELVYDMTLSFSLPLCEVPVFGVDVSIWFLFGERSFFEEAREGGLPALPLGDWFWV